MEASASLAKSYTPGRQREVAIAGAQIRSRHARTCYYVLCSSCATWPVCENVHLPTPERLPSTSSSLPQRGHDAISETSAAADPISIALSYHQQTKHHLNRYARSLGYLDWASQPDPFRTFEGAIRLELPLAADSLTTPFADLYTPVAVPVRPLELKNIAILFELALGLSAWKEFRGDRWALRCNPSSGNLHPTEGYAIVPSVLHLEAGVSCPLGFALRSCRVAEAASAS